MFFLLGMQAPKLAGSHAVGKGKVSVYRDFSTRKLNKPIPSQNKAFHTERQCSGAAAKAAAGSRAVPAVVNWNVLETVCPPPTHPIKLPWRRRYRVLIWIPDCFLNAVWSGCVGGDEPVCWGVGHTGARACCVLPVSSREGQACKDKMAGWPWALSTRSGEGGSEPSLCLQSGKQDGSRNQLVEPPTQLRRAGQGHGRERLRGTPRPSCLAPSCWGIHQSSSPNHRSRGTRSPSCGSAGPAAGRALLTVQGSGQNRAQTARESRRW